MNDLMTALGLLLVIEGLAYAIAPIAMKRGLLLILDSPPESLRRIGLAAAVIGFGLVWLIKG